MTLSEPNVQWFKEQVVIPDGGFISIRDDGSVSVPSDPIIPFILGDGIGEEISPVMINIINRAVQHAYRGSKIIRWVELLAGDKAHKLAGTRAPQETLEVLKRCVVGIKGPLGTPIGGGGRSLNAMLRQALDFYSAVRQVTWVGQPGTPAQNPAAIDAVIFRENSDDVYVAVEYFPKKEDTKKVREFFVKEMGVSGEKIPEDSGITIKPMSEFKSKRHVRKALRYALANGRKRATLVGKGNIMQATEGAFLKWGKEVAEEPEFKGRVAVDTMLTDQCLMQLALKPESFDIIVTQNLNGDYISDLAGAMVGGPGFVPSGNIGDGFALFESTHGTAMDIAGRGIANPISIVLSGAMMLGYLGWSEAATLVQQAVRRSVEDRMGTGDIEASYKKAGIAAKAMGTEEFGRAIADRIGG